MQPNLSHDLPVKTAEAAPVRGTLPSPDGTGHRFDTTLVLTPFAVLAGSGSFAVKDGLYEVGPEASYGFRPSRYAEIGLGVGYRSAWTTGDGLLGHVLAVPAHMKAVIPVGGSAEVDVGVSVGFTQLWVVNQPAGTLSASGVDAGPRVGVAVTLTETFAALVETGVSWQFMEMNEQPTDVDSSGRAFPGFYLPVAMGLRWKP